MGLLLQMGQDEPLPVAVEVRPRGRRRRTAARSPLPRLEQQVHLGVVAERLVVPDPLHRRGDRLPVEDAALPEADLHPEPFPDEAAQHLELHLAHELHMELLERLVPHDVQLRVLLLKPAETGERGVRVHSPRQFHPVAEHRTQRRELGIRLRAEALPGTGAGKPRGGAHHAGERLLHRPELRPRIDAQLVDLLLPRLPLPASGNRRLDPEAAAGDLQVGEPDALLVPADLVDLRAERLPARGLAGIAREPREERVHPLEPERRAEKAGEHPPLRDGLRQSPRLRARPPRDTAPSAPPSQRATDSSSAPRGRSAPKSAQPPSSRCLQLPPEAPCGPRPAGRAYSTKRKVGTR